MELNAANRAMLYQGYSAAFQKGLAHRPPMWQAAAMLVPSSTSENVYDWLKDTFSIREWLGDRQKQNLATADYVVKNRKFEGTMEVDRDKVADNQYGSNAVCATRCWRCNGRSGAMASLRMSNPRELSLRSLMNSAGKCSPM